MAQPGPKIAKVSETVYRDFASIHAVSPEIGSIQTAFDADVRHSQKANYEQALVGLWGCATLCAVADFHLYPSETDSASRVLKLDSVIVDRDLRRRGLAGLLVARGFADLVSEPGRKVASIYAHSVHPATVRLLRRLRFKDPNVIGAPLSRISFAEENSEAVRSACESQVRDRLNRLKLQCEFCRNTDKRSRPWCSPRGVKPNPL